MSVYAGMADRVFKNNFRSVQHQSFSQVEGFVAGIQITTQNRVSNSQAVQSQLV